jgi:hypothetical protein
LDKIGADTIVNYNNNFNHPLIIGGWNILKEFYGFSHNVDVEFTYYENRCFSVSKWHNLEPYNQIPPFHSRSTIPTKTSYFDVLLTEENVTKTKIVKYYLILNYMNVRSYISLIYE